MRVTYGEVKRGKRGEHDERFVYLDGRWVGCIETHWCDYKFQTSRGRTRRWELCMLDLRHWRIASHRFLPFGLEGIDDIEVRVNPERPQPKQQLSRLKKKIKEALAHVQD